jgi:hypothetical protein
MFVFINALHPKLHSKLYPALHPALHPFFTGVIDKDDLRCILHDITDFVITEEQLQGIMELCGGAADGTLSMEGFVQGLLFHENKEEGGRWVGV